jgi:hypothetical protein
MIVQAKITDIGAHPLHQRATEHKRGTPEYPLSAWDLLEFGRSPLRWVETAPEEDAGKVGFGELLRVMHHTPHKLDPHYMHRPETFQFSKLTCPKCGSTSDARTCRNCNVPRQQVYAEKAWSANHRVCADWTDAAVKAGKRVVPHHDWEKARQACARLNADEEIAEFKRQSDEMVAISGDWLDQATGLRIPVQCLLSYVPKEGESHDDKVGSLCLTRDAAPAAWAASAYAQGRHVVAAFKQMLHGVAVGDPRPHHVWVLLERDEPHVVGRRCTSPEMLNAGRQALGELMGAYAQCLKSNRWPGFDPGAPGTADAWTPFHLEPWMTQGNGKDDRFFGVQAATQLRQEKALAA